MPENPASYRVVRTKSYLFNKAVRWCYRRQRMLFTRRQIYICSVMLPTVLLNKSAVIVPTY
ncbi:hypothetical protein FEE38_28550 (plasmid) [Klebsiella pneumoniae]|nr:hypothetical protein FEE38_28550 [Klebsiella pneumoniae]